MFDCILNDVLSTLAVVEHTFYLTGSRAIKNKEINIQTDYDFFAEYSESLENYLKANRFNRAGVYYKDQSVKAVYRRERVDVQLIDPSYMKAKISANEFLKKHPYIIAGGKEHARIVWSALLFYIKNVGD